MEVSVLLVCAVVLHQIPHCTACACATFLYHNCPGAAVHPVLSAFVHGVLGARLQHS